MAIIPLPYYPFNTMQSRIFPPHSRAKHAILKACVAVLLAYRDFMNRLDAYSALGDIP
jgi:hypothetical protein